MKTKYIFALVAIYGLVMIITSEEPQSTIFFSLVYICLVGYAVLDKLDDILEELKNKGKS